MPGESVVERLTSLRQHQQAGRRSPHKPLLVLLALGRLVNTGSSRLEWSQADTELGSLLAEFGTTRMTSAAYPYTRLRADGVWNLTRDVDNDSKSQLASAPIAGQFPDDIEQQLRADPRTIDDVARRLVEAQFPSTVAPDVLAAVGLDPEVILNTSLATTSTTTRRRDATWRRAVIENWDRSCAFCGFDGSLGGAPVGLEAAHVRWFTHEGPDDLDNGLALCALHHKLLDRGAIGLADPETVVVSTQFTARSDVGRALYEIHGRRLRPRPGTPLPAETHVDWHTAEVFKGHALPA